MCGLAGYFSYNKEIKGDPNAILTRAGDAIRHRGPDDSGVWVEPKVQLGFVHRRLAIQDLSDFGKQPMQSASGRYVLVFNGEIYNFLSLKKELHAAGYSFNGHSDTEVMLVAFECWGFEKALERFSGMFAFVLYDKSQKCLLLARDRMGEKPLYYGWVNGIFVFSSELKALQTFPFWSGEINRDALTLLVRHNFIPSPHSIYKNIFKLPPASYLKMGLSDQSADSFPKPIKYWLLEDCFEENQYLNVTRKQAADSLDGILREVINEQMISDVPFGAFLSGGVDSSVITAIMQQLSSSKVQTFTIGFDDKRYNEAIYAKAVAEHLGTKHSEIYVTAKDALDVIPQLPMLYDEPFADSSQIPTFLVTKMARQHVTVALSGDGGDELFCGYSRYFSVNTAWSKRDPSSSNLANSLFKMAADFTPAVLSKLIKIFVRSQQRLSEAEISEKISRRSLLLSINEFDEFYRQTISYWNQSEAMVLNAVEPVYSMQEKSPKIIGSKQLKQMMWQDLNCYLPDDILTKVDRAAMASSLETRVPLLDRRVTEFALGLPVALNVEGNQGKQVLREVLYRYVPKNLIERPKRGFAVPMDEWLRTDLKDWAEALISQSRLEDEGIWNSELVRRKWHDHSAGKGDHAFSLWGVLMFQAWKENVDGLH